ncbi:hypothetical protein HAX54_040447, partial [Datura stramonium]|nr:hypothetical protein [Datura stramonium]
LKSKERTLWMHSTGRCDNKQPVLCSCRFHSIEDMFKTMIANQAQLQADYVKLAAD